MKEEKEGKEGENSNSRRVASPWFTVFPPSPHTAEGSGRSRSTRLANTQGCARLATGPTIRLQQITEVSHRLCTVGIQCAPIDRSDIEKANLAGEEARHRDLVSGVQNRWARAAARERFVGESETRKLDEIRLEESELRGSSQIKGRQMGQR